MAKIEPVPLQHSGGFVGEPAAKHLTEPGCPDWRNVMHLADGQTLIPFDGYRRVLNFKLENLSDVSLDQGLRIVLFDAPTVFGMDGVGIALVDYTLADPDRRVIAMGINKHIAASAIDDGGAAWDPSAAGREVLVVDPGATTPTNMGEFMPELARLDAFEKARFIQERTRTHMVHEHSEPIVLEGSRIRRAGIRAPALKPIINIKTDEAESDNKFEYITGSNINPVLVNGVGQGDFDTPLHPEDTVPSGYNGTNLPACSDGVIWRNNHSGNIEADHKFVSFWLRYDKHFNNTAVNEIPANIIAFNVADTIDLGGTVHTLTVDKILPHDSWVKLTIPWTHGAFRVASVGLVFLKAMDTPSENADPNNKVIIGFDAMFFLKPLKGEFEGRAQSTFTWYNRDSREESDPAPNSDWLDTGTFGVSLEIDLSGFRQIDDDPALPDHNIVTKPDNATDAKVYLFQPFFGQASYGGAKFLNATGLDGYPAINLANVGLRDSNIVSIGGADDSTDCVAAPITLEELLDGEELHPFNWPRAAAKYSKIDGDRLLVLAESDFSVGQAIVSHPSSNSFSGIITFSTSNPWERWYPWMEGRRITIFDPAAGKDGISQSEKRYVIIQWIDDTHIRISKDFNPDANAWRESYFGNAGTFDYKIFGAKDVARFSAKTGRKGTNFSYFPVINEINIPGSDLQGIVRSGGFTCFVGRDGVWRASRNPIALDDDPAGPSVYTNPVKIKGSVGCAAPDTITEFNDSQAGWISTDNRIVTGSAAAGFTVNEDLSEKIRGYLTTMLKVFPESIRHAWAWFDAIRGHWVIHLVERNDVALGRTTYLEEGSTYNLATPPNDFEKVLRIDIENGIVYPGENIPITAILDTEAGSPDFSKGPAEHARRYFIADRYGYVYETGMGRHHSFGLPRGGARQGFIYTVTASSGGTNIQIDISGGKPNFPTTGDGAKNLEAVLIRPDGTTERELIDSNTTTDLTLASAYSPVPAVGDEVIVSPIDMMIEFPHRHSSRAINPNALIMDIQFDVNDGVSATEPRFDLELHAAARAADGRSVSEVDTSGTPARTVSFDSDRLRRTGGQIPLPATNEKKLAYRLKGFAPTMELKIGGLGIVEVKQ